MTGKLVEVIFTDLPHMSPKEYQEIGYCPSCFGAGEISRFGFKSVECSTCKGTGEFPYQPD